MAREWRYRIGETQERLAELGIEVSKATLRIWDRRGILTAQRSPGGWRIYTESQLQVFARNNTTTTQGEVS